MSNDYFNFPQIFSMQWIGPLDQWDTVILPHGLITDNLSGVVLQTHKRE